MQPEELESPPRVLCFNASDPLGVAGLAADLLAVASVGSNACTVATCVMVRDTSGVHDLLPLDGSWIADQTEAVGQDLDLAAVKVGLCGSIQGLHAVAEVLADCDDLPIVVHLSDLTWMDAKDIDDYHDALAQLIVPSATVLCGNHHALARWLLPDWDDDRPPRARDLARAAAQLGAPWVLATNGPAEASDHVRDVLASAEQEALVVEHPRLPQQFLGAGDALSAALAAGLSTGLEPAQAAHEALRYTLAALAQATVPSMHAAIPNWLFWAQEDDACADGDADSDRQTSANGDVAADGPMDASRPADATLN
jgi:hydroxymethylpyrimidine/phosphomethylpyrimidine kinase